MLALETLLPVRVMVHATAPLISQLVIAPVPVVTLTLMSTILALVMPLTSLTVIRDYAGVLVISTMTLRHHACLALLSVQDATVEVHLTATATAGSSSS